MEQQHIHCLISDCHYWQQGNKCSARQILVVSDRFSQNQPDRIDALMAGELTPEQAGSSPETCCKTYVPKGSKLFWADGIEKQ
ncbi:MAG: DUF1540 domain-containing protein [Peptococcaceae bacterium]